MPSTSAEPRGIAIATPAIEIEQVTKRFSQPRPIATILRRPFSRQRIEVLRGIDLRVEAGCLTGILGPNGSGKTTLLRILSATVLPDSGTVRILGQDISRHSHRVRQRIGVVLGDERSFFWRLTAEQNLNFFAALCNLTGRAARARIEELAGVLDLGGELSKPFRNLSSGWRHRLALARALLHDPEVLLMDEPTRGLDPGAAGQARRLIAEQMVGRMGKTVLMATHDLAEAREVCTRVALLKDGAILAEGHPEKILDRVDEIFDLERS